jgi:hypothetical protein
MGLLALQVVAVLASWGILAGHRFNHVEVLVLLSSDTVPTVLLLAMALSIAVRVARGRNVAINRYARIYLGTATAQVMLNIALLVSSGRPRHESLVWGLCVLGGAYLLVVAVFSGWYWLYDQTIPGGAFDFPEAEVLPNFRPNLIDYVFISFNTNSTFGPTAELIKSRHVKVLMMLQTSLSLAILLVFVARLTGLTR